MSVSATNPGEDLPYQDISKAQKITLGTAATFGVQNPDADASGTQWGTFDIAVPSIVTVTVSTPVPTGVNWNAPNKLSAELHAFDGEDTPSIASESCIDGDTTVSSDSSKVNKSANSKYALMPGTYYVKASAYWNIYGTVTVTAAPVKFSAQDKEYNNDKLNAQKIAFNTAYTGLIGYAGVKDAKKKLISSAGYDYYDLYAFTVPTDGTAIKLDFSRPNDGETRSINAHIIAGDDVTSYWKENDVNMWNALGDTVNLKDKVSGSTTAKLGKGTYYVEVSSSWAKAGDYTIKLTNYKLTVAAKKSIAKGKSFDLGAKSTPATKLYYKSSDSSVAAVNLSGKVTAKKAGSAIITVYAGSQGSAFYKECKVTVTSLPTKIKLNATSKALKKGKSFTVKVKTWTPAKAYIAKADQKLKFSSSNKKVATVNAAGKIVAKKKGTATITVKTVNGKTAKCKITVK
jgi:uncharacterized protein YjdB